MNMYGFFFLFLDFNQSIVSLLDSIKNNRSIKSLAIGQNFDNVKPK